LILGKFNDEEKLEGILRLGLGEAEFFAVLTKCADCRLVMTKPSYLAHECHDNEVGSDIDGGTDEDDDDDGGEGREKKWSALEI
jgi:hypothetical protein